jgi:hypothetical protein
MGMQLSYSSKFRVECVVPAVVNHVTDSYVKVQTSICTLLFTAFVHGFRRGNAKKILSFRRKFIKKNRSSR